MYQVVNNLSHQAGAHALQGRRRLPLQRRPHHLSARGPRELRVLVAGELPGRRLQQRRLHPDVRRHRGLADEPERRRLRAGRVEGQPASHAEPGRPLRPAVPRDDQHRPRQRLAAARRRLVAVRLAAHGRPRQRRPVLRPRAAARARQRAAVGRQHDRSDQPAADRREPVADAGGRAGVPEHPQRRRAVGHAGQPDDDGPRPAERVLAAGQRRGRAAARRARHGQRRLPVSARPQPADVGQPERADLRGRRAPTTAAGRIPTYAQQQPVLVGRRLELPRPARLVHAAAGALGPLSGLVHAVEVDEQRRRVLLQLADRSVRPLEGLGPLGRRPAAPARDQRRRCRRRWSRRRRPGNASDARLPAERHAAGVLGAAVQHHLGRDDDSGHGRPADRRRRVHRAERRHRQRLLQPERAA